MRVMLAWMGLDDLVEAGVRAPKEDVKSRPHLTWALTRGEVPAELVVILNNLPGEQRDGWLAWVRPQITKGVAIEVVEAPITNPVDYGQIHRECVRVVEGVRKRVGASAELCFFLNSGTPPMGNVWVLLGKSQYPATLLAWATDQGRVVPVEVPFEIFADYVRTRTSESLRASGLRPPPDAAFANIVRGCAAMEDAIARAQRVATHDVPVLIEGESGTGKELFATAIHNASPRKKYPFKAINCGAIPKDLLQSELFGHSKGGFTGAVTDKKGLFELAHGGTVFLDEIGELAPELQVKLLRPLQEGEVQAVGAPSPVKVNVRIIAATNRHLAGMVGEDKFREDLFYRLAVAVLTIPPLRDREGDLTLLAQAQLKDINGEHRQLGLPTRRLGPDARNRLRRHHWPGNVRELAATLRRAMLWANNEVLHASDIEEALLVPRPPKQEAVLQRRLGGDFKLNEVLLEVERQYLERALSQARGNKTRAADLLGLGSHQVLGNRMRRAGIV